MPEASRYIRFCKGFQNRKLPKLRFKEIDERYRFLIKEKYGIEEDDINKVSFLVFLSSFIILNFLFIGLKIFNPIYILLGSFIISIILAYYSNTFIYRRIKKDETIINAFLFLIQIDFSLIKKTLNPNSDYCINFIKLIISYNIPISETFKEMMRKIHEGETPEDCLLKLISASSDFNEYKDALLMSKFNYIYNITYFDEKTSERYFKIYLRSIESKISIIFFIGIFFPIGFCFLILLRYSNAFFSIVFILLLFFLLHFFFKKFIRIDLFLIGLLRKNTRIDRQRFNEFLVFLRRFAINLKKNHSPEKAFLDTFFENKNNFIILGKFLNIQLNQLQNLSYSFKEIITHLGIELGSVRYRLIMDIISKMIEESGYMSSEKIFDILFMINKHKKLEKKLEIIIKGEKFKIAIFLFLLPIIIGTIGGTLPFFLFFTRTLNESLTNNYILLFNLGDIILIFIILLISNSISSYYFLKIINYEKVLISIILTCSCFTFTFLLAFLNLYLTYV